MTRALSGLVALAALMACSAPATPPPAQTSPPPPTLAQTPLPLDAQLALAPPDTDFLAIRDLQAIVDQGVPWLAFAIDETDDPRRTRAAAFVKALGKWVDGPDPPLARAGIDLRGGLLLSEGYQKPPLLFLAGTNPDLAATLLTTLPVPDSEQIACSAFPSPPGMLACSTRDGAQDLHRPGDAATHRRDLAAALPDVDLDAAMLLAHAPSLHTDLAATFSPRWQVVHFRYTAGITFNSLARDFTPGPPTLLRFVEPGASYAWVRVDGPAVRQKASLQNKGQPIDTIIAQWTGEMLFAGSAAPAAVQLRLGLADADAAARALADSLGERYEEPLPGFADGTLIRESLTTDIDGLPIHLLDSRVEGAPELATIAALLGVTTRAQLFISRGSAAMIAGAPPEALSKMVVHPDATAALAALPAEAAADVSAGRAIFLAFIDANALHSPAMSAALTTLQPHFLARDVAEVRDTLHALAAVSRVAVWGTEIDDKVVVHVALETIGNTLDDEGRAALAALTAIADGGQAFAALARTYPDSPRKHAYALRSGALGPAALPHSLLGVGLFGGLLLHRLITP